MSIWRRCLVCVLVLSCALVLGHAQARNDAQEKEAQDLMTLGEAKMKVMAWEEAITQFSSILTRYPNTDTRYDAEYRMADALVSLKKEKDALDLLNSVVNEENPDQSPRALFKIGDIFAGQQKYTEAFTAYRQIISDYPDSPMVDHAYFAIGVTHFRLGHFGPAADELLKVGTAYASRVPELQRVSPGEPLNVRLVEPNMVATVDMKIQVMLATSSGDQETVTLHPDIEGGDHFSASIPTKLGKAVKSNGILELYGNDTVKMSYKNRYVSEGAKDKTITMSVASTGRLTIRNEKNEEVRGVVVSYPMIVQLYDPDLDLTDKKDTVKVDVKTKHKDLETVTLTETEEHSGLFTAKIDVITGDPTPNSGKIETDAGPAEGSATMLDDYVEVVFMDEVHLNPKQDAPLKITTRASLYAGGNNIDGVQSPTTKVRTPAEEIKMLIGKGRSMNEIAGTYRDLGQDALATKTYNKAIDQFQKVLQTYPNAQEVEDAMYGLFQSYVGQDQYESAISIIAQINQRFPTSTRASRALFELAALHVKREEYDRALGIYQNLVQRAKGTPLAEEAQYKICEVYLAMYRPKASIGGTPSQISASTVADGFLQFVLNYPNSDRAPEAMWQLARFRNDSEDYRGAVDVGKKMVALYPDNVMTGRVLMLMAQGQVKLRDYKGAIETLQMIVADYGSEADAAEKMLVELLRKYGTAAGGTGGATGGAAAGG